MPDWFGLFREGNAIFMVVALQCVTFLQLNMVVETQIA